MQRATVHFTKSLVIFILLSAAAPAAPIEIAGTLRDTNGAFLSGPITIFQQGRQMIVTDHQVDATGNFRIASDAAGGIVVYAESPGYPPAEKAILAGAAGVVSLNFVLPLGQDVRGRVIDARGKGVPDASVQVRYHEPGKPVRRVSFNGGEHTDAGGRFLLRDVGIQVPFYVDVYAADYVAASSKRTKLAAGAAAMDDIVLGEPGASVVVNLLDKSGAPVSGADVMLLADPAGLSSEARGSWLHHRSFRQRAAASARGNVRFSGVPPGRIIVRAKTSAESIEQRAVAVSAQELRLTLRALQ